MPPTVPLIVDIRAVRLSDGGPSSDAPAVDNRTDAAPIRRSPPTAAIAKATPPRPPRSATVTKATAPSAAWGEPGEGPWLSLTMA